jgi:hypothetical protein
MNYAVHFYIFVKLSNISSGDRAPIEHPPFSVYNNVKKNIR